MSEPRPKEEIGRPLKEDGEVVAMTGDGVNVVPAQKFADIGIAICITGTEIFLTHTISDCFQKPFLPICFESGEVPHFL